MAQHSLTTPRFNQLLKEHPDAIAAAIFRIFVLLGRFFLPFNLVGLALLILSFAYVIGGYKSAHERLTTLFVEITT